MSDAIPHRRNWFIVAALGSLVVTLWAPSLGASFQFDDWHVIIDDSRVLSIAAWWQSMPGMRALLKLSYAFNHETAGLAARLLGSEVAGFRAFNIAVHVVNVALVFALCLRLGSALDSSRNSRALGAAIFAATLFALHPVQTEVVTYISGRSCSLVAMFSLSSLLLWLKYLDAQQHPWLLLLCLLAFCLALTCKETAVMVPAVMALWLWVSGQGSWRVQLRMLWPFTAVLLAATAYALIVLPYLRLFAWSQAGAALPTNLLSQAHGVSYLLGQLCLLEPLNADPALARHDVLDLETALRGIAILALLALGVRSVRRAPAFAFGLLWFFLWLAPTNSLVPRMDVANDRQLYLAMVGPAWLLGWSLFRLPHGHRPWPGVLAVVTLTILLGDQTVRRNRVYATETSFWLDVLTKTPNNARAANNLGMAYAIDCQKTQAIASFDLAARLAPNDIQPVINRGLLERGDLPGVPNRCAALDRRAPAN